MTKSAYTKVLTDKTKGGCSFAIDHRSVKNVIC
jgi:hypothetical protein